MRICCGYERIERCAKFFPFFARRKTGDRQKSFRQGNLCDKTRARRARGNRSVRDARQRIYHKLSCVRTLPPRRRLRQRMVCSAGKPRRRDAFGERACFRAERKTGGAACVQRRKQRFFALESQRQRRGSERELCGRLGDGKKQRVCAGQRKLRGKGAVFRTGNAGAESVYRGG